MKVTSYTRNCQKCKKYRKFGIFGNFVTLISPAFFDEKLNQRIYSCSLESGASTGEIICLFLRFKWVISLNTLKFCRNFGIFEISPLRRIPQFGEL